MVKKDWGAVGLKCGIEIHQQLNTTKLFCGCPTEVRDDQPDIEIMRELRAAAGEQGAVDAAAAAEQAKGKRYLYQAYRDTTCLVELDAEPPHPLNNDALGITLQVAKLLNAMPVDFVQVMRKTVVDGSNTSGFQRTALVARNGLLKSNSGGVTIPSICLEEDAAKIISRTAECDTYNLSRLGIPLIEIATGPEITSPEMCREVAATLGMLLRSTGRVKRGLGTIRQDLNVSIKGGARVELKGCQELDMLPVYVEYEAVRQKTLLEIAAELKKRKAAVAKQADLSTLLRKTTCKILRSALDNKGVVLCARLKGFTGLLGKEVQPGRRLGTELADYAKAFGGVKGLFHSDELPGHGITADEVIAIRKALKCDDTDAFILVADKNPKASRAMDAAIERARTALSGIQGSVRRANPDGTSSYMRPMPGAARMYPETDVRGIRITSAMLKKITVPELLIEKEKRFVKQYTLSKETARLVAWSGRADYFEGSVKRFPSLKAQFIADTLVSAPKEIKKRYKLKFEPEEKDLNVLFEAVHKGEIAPDAVFEVLLARAEGKQLDLGQYKTLPDADLKKLLKALVKSHKGVPFGGLMGLAMKQLRGKAEGKKIAAILKGLASK